jgi:hypothetical protein
MQAEKHQIGKLAFSEAVELELRQRVQRAQHNYCLHRFRLVKIREWATVGKLFLIIPVLT